MLNEKIRSAIANLSLSFNEIEFVIEIAVIELLFCRDRTVAEHVVSGMPMARKIETAKRLTKYYRREHPGVDIEAQEFLSALYQVGSVTKRRNELVYAIMSTETGLPDSFLFNRAQWENINTDLGELQKDVERSKALRDNIFCSHGRLSRKLQTVISPTCD